jgi:predicted RNA binding protein YcfA (HicA-like mRNA interferase family)
MAFTKTVWNQLKNLTKGELVSALERDGWTLEKPSASSGAIRLFIKYDPQGKPLKRVELHYHHSSDTMGPGLLKGLLADAAWTDKDMRRLKLIK